jgi:hypothetical protein
MEEPHVPTANTDTIGTSVGSTAPGATPGAPPLHVTGQPAVNATVAVPAITTGTLIVHAQTVQLVPPSDHDWTRRYWVNAILFFALTAGLFIWLKLHFENLATQHLLAGTLTAWALWKAIQPLLSDFKDPAQQFRKSFMGTPQATEYLVAGLAVLVLLFLTTASMTVHLEDKRLDLQHVTLRLTTDGGRALIPDVKVTPLTPVSSRPLLGRFSSDLVTVQVLDPPGYDSKDVTMRPWTPLTLHFPSDFTAHSYRIIRLVPGVSLRNLPQPQDPSEQYTLTISGPQGDHRFPDYRYHTVYIGASKADLERLITTYSPDRFRSELHDHLVKRGVPPVGRDPYLVAWTAPVHTLSTPEYAHDVKIKIIIGRPNEEPLLEYPLTVGRESLRTVVLEKATSQ